ncbi:hypothetical protein IGI04_030197 [Brassica rapa subsp. trilocularis]|uniref:Secreted protein n=1 Tax=Brassica rapa subsp. trilocularis TaxID=1813537 RepID=A0ABQ7LTY8_BRACM|nr:hypothetical protein IGI04_030197 [Brassica rapa subsp. trilocularis]
MAWQQFPVSLCFLVWYLVCGLRVWLRFCLFQRSCPSSDTYSLRVMVKWVYTVPVECNGGCNLRRNLLNDGIVSLRLFLVLPVVSFILPALCSWLDSSLWFVMG